MSTEPSQVPVASPVSTADVARFQAIADRQTAYRDSFESLGDVPTTFGELQAFTNARGAYAAYDPSRDRFGDILPAADTQLAGISGNHVALKSGQDYILHQYPLTTNPPYMSAFMGHLMTSDQQVMVDLTNATDVSRRGLTVWYPTPALGATETVNYGTYSVTSTTTATTPEYDVLTLSIQDASTVTGTPVLKTMVHYKKWPDHGVPGDDFVGCMRGVVVPLLEGRGAIINCTAGVGRSGTAAVTLETLVAPEADPVTDQDILAMVVMGREQRAKVFVQTPDQLAFLRK